MDWYEQEVSALEARLRISPPPPGLVAFYGSSSLRMWEDLEDQFPDAGVLNLAFGGSTMEACAWFFERLVVPCHPRAIVCYAGDNDLGDGRRAEDVLISFRKLLLKVDQFCPGIPFTLLGIKASPSRWQLVEVIKKTNDLIRHEILSRPGGNYIDLFSAMLVSDGTPDTALFLEDGLHVSPKGYLVWKQLLEQHSGEIFGKERDL